MVRASHTEELRIQLRSLDEETKNALVRAFDLAISDYCSKSENRGTFLELFDHHFQAFLSER
jgi:hypothetical protein